MRIAAARVVPYCLPLRRPWTAASATLIERHGLLLAVSDADGITGWGDCAPLPSSGAAAQARVFAALTAAARDLPGKLIDDGPARFVAARAAVAHDLSDTLGDAGPQPLGLLDPMQSLQRRAVMALPPPEPLPDPSQPLPEPLLQSLPELLLELLPESLPESRWALETALMDLAARRRGLPLARFLGGAGLLPVPVNAALGALDAGCAARAVAALAQGYAVAKIKVGVDEVDAELGRLRALNAATGGRLRLRLDANCAWADADAWRFLTAVAELPIDGVEEPLAAPTTARLARLQAALPFALAVDESLAILGLDAVLDAPAVRRLAIKPARAGGMAATLALAAQARQAGVEVVLTSVVDSVVGVAAAAHLAAALGGAAELAHGLATGEWLAADLAPPLTIAGGHLALPDAPGLGFDPD